MSADANPLDVVTRLLRWRIKLERSNSDTPLVSTISAAVAEIERLRRANEKLQTEREQLQRIATGRSLRGGGGWRGEQAVDTHCTLW